MAQEEGCSGEMTCPCRFCRDVRAWLLRRGVRPAPRNPWQPRPPRNT